MKSLCRLSLLSLLLSVAFCISNNGFEFYENATPGVVTLGPYNIAPHQMAMENNFLTLNVPGNGYGLVEFKIELLNGEGEVIDQDYAYLHYYEVVDSMATDKACPEKQSNLIVAAGADLGAIQLQQPYYIEIPSVPSSRWQYTAHVINPNDVDITVFIRTTYYYIKVDSQVNVEVAPFFISVAGCSTSEFDIEGKENSTYYRYLQYESTVGGVIVWSRGHLRRGGNDIYLMDPHSGAVLVNSRAHYNNPLHSDWITSIDVLYPSVHIDVNQTLLIGCEYDGSQDIQGATGFLLSYVVISEFYNGNQQSRESIGINVSPFEITSSNWSFFTVFIILLVCFVCFLLGIAAVILPLVSFYFYQKSKDAKPKFSRLSDEMEGMDDISMF